MLVDEDKTKEQLINELAELRKKITEGIESNHKDADKASLASEEQYRIIIDNMPEGVAVFQDGRLLFINDVSVSMFGYRNKDQLVGKEPSQLFSDDFKQDFKKIIGGLHSGISCEKALKAACLKQDGREFWAEWSNNLIKWNGKQAVFSTIREISEGRHQEEIAAQNGAEHLQKNGIKRTSSIKDRYRFRNIIGKSPAMQEVYEFIEKTADFDVNIVVYGESGTGKEMVTRTIHEISHRRDRAFVSVNCGAIPETLLESELFGYKKGAFTGANADKHGFLDLADGGTLFLDELEEIGLNMQVKLLRAIDGGGYTPVGSTETKNSDFRIIAATNGDLSDLVSKGLIREDFFYRIHVIPITVPPLRDRKEDIPLLIEHFSPSFKGAKKPTTIPAKVMEAMYNYHWPGNIRELQNVLHRYLTVKRLDLMGAAATRPDYLNDSSVEELDPADMNFHKAVEKFQKDVIIRALELNQWHKGRAASMLGIDRKTLFRKMRSFEVR